VRRRSATSARSTSVATSVRSAPRSTRPTRSRASTGEARPHGPHGRASARPRDRPELLPDDRGRRVQRTLAPGGPGPDGPAGRVLPAPPAFDSEARRCRRSASRRRSTSGRSRRAPRSPQRRARTRSFHETRAAAGELQFDAWGVTPTDALRWDALRARIKETGLRNSLLIAIAPTATIASIAGCYECIEPQVSNLFKRETLSGDFLQINRYLVTELQGPRPVDRVDAQPHQARGGLGAGRRRRSRRTLRLCTARRGRCRCARSSTWRPTAAPSSTRASRSTCSSRAPTSASSRRCTSTRGRRASRPRTTCARARRRASPRPSLAAARVGGHCPASGVSAAVQEARHGAGAASALKAKALDAASATDARSRHSMPPEANATAPVDPRVPAQALAAVACSLENPESCEACQ
jgi:hypothetical protein